jgi:hypothetical protein
VGPSIRLRHSRSSLAWDDNLPIHDVDQDRHSRSSLAWDDNLPIHGDDQDRHDRPMLTPRHHLEAVRKSTRHDLEALRYSYLQSHQTLFRW